MAISYHPKRGIRIVLKVVAVLFGLFMLAVTAVLLLFLWPFPLEPKIARDLPDNIADADKVFSERVLAKYPMPISEAELASSLAEQGFTIDQSHSYAVFERLGPVCRNIWRVLWEAENEVVTKITPEYGAACL